MKNCRFRLLKYNLKNSFFRSEYKIKKNKKEDDGFEETLIPELCYLISCPAWYCLKVTLLPSVFHRVHHLLIAEEFRQTIAAETGMGTLDLPNGSSAFLNIFLFEIC